jgi:hypothetical protein
MAATLSLTLTLTLTLTLKVYPELNTTRGRNPPYYGTDPGIFPEPTPGVDHRKFAVEDTLLVPVGILAGEYVLGWRWDCEMSSQVWSTCADITII